VPALAGEVRNNLRGKRKDNPLEKKTRTLNERTHTRPATHDEVLITRIASRVVHSVRVQVQGHDHATRRHTYRH
jgi:hypothetical protein